MAVPTITITLVEPDEAVRSALSTLLEGRGWKVLALDNGKALDETLDEATPEVVVCESTLPDMSAASVLDACNQRQIPLVFLGHQTDVQSAVDLVRMGARDFLEKPFPQARLLSLLDNLLDKNVN